MNYKRKNEEDTQGSKRGRKSDDKKPHEPSDDESRWADLPSIAVEKIYGYLNREDQCRMSMVCRNWNRELDSPSIWRKFEFLVPERHLNLEVYPEVLFARKYGDMFRHVEIVWNAVVQWSHRELIWVQVKLFLEALAFHSTLETVKILHMINHSPYYHAISGDVHQTIKNFFLSQHQLKTVEIRDTFFTESAEAEILRAIFRNNSKSLQNVTLVNDEDEFDPVCFGDYEITENVGNEAIFESFLNVKTLRLNYHYFFGNIMIAFHEYIQNSDSRRTIGNLELIEIVICYDQGFDHDRFRKIPPEFWKLLTKICPSLRLNLTLQILEYGDEIRDVIDLFVGPTMPLKVLIIELDYDVTVYDDDDSAETRIGVFFRHLQSRVSKDLEYLSIVWPRESSLTIDLTGLLQTFQKLRNLDISTEEEGFANESPRTCIVTERNVEVTVVSSVQVHLITNGETRN